MRAPLYGRIIVYIINVRYIRIYTHAYDKCVGRVQRVEERNRRRPKIYTQSLRPSCWRDTARGPTANRTRFNTLMRLRGRQSSGKLIMTKKTHKDRPNNNNNYKKRIKKHKTHTRRCPYSRRITRTYIIIYDVLRA